MEALALLRDTDEPDLSLSTVLLVGQEGAGKTCLMEALLGRSIVPTSTDRRLARCGCTSYAQPDLTGQVSFGDHLALHNGCH